MQQLLFLLFFFGAVDDDHVSVLFCFFYCKHNVSHTYSKVIDPWPCGHDPNYFPRKQNCGTPQKTSGIKLSLKK